MCDVKHGREYVCIVDTFPNTRNYFVNSSLFMNDEDSPLVTNINIKIPRTVVETVNTTSDRFWNDLLKLLTPYRTVSSAAQNTN